MKITPDEWEICLKVLQNVSEGETTEITDRFHSLIVKIYQQRKNATRRAIAERQRKDDRDRQAQTGIVQNQLRASNNPPLPNSSAQIAAELTKPISCYICKNYYTQLHFFYHMLCPTCAAFNYQKRTQSTNLTGRVALITGGRIKIGYQTALKMLRDGAKVIITTRFPRDAARRYSQEPDFDQWRSRLQIYPLDLRHIPSVEAFIQYILSTEKYLDIIINNAAQTIKRSRELYQHLLEGEENLQKQLLPGGVESLIAHPKKNLLAGETEGTDTAYTLAAISSNLHPQMFDADGEPVDLRPSNSWRLKLADVTSLEMLEVQLINVMAPFILNSQLKRLLQQSPFQRRFIINVSAMEGQFTRQHKTIYHPHTNMAKAALNMMTRTSAADYAKDNIFMNSVDTGWITNENPHHMKTYLQSQRGFYPPLDVIDGMARIYDPIVQGIENSAPPLFGHFLKDYAPYPW